MTIDWGTIASLTLQHLYLSLLGTALGALVGIGGGTATRNWRRLTSWFLGLSEVIQTVPSIALLAILLLLFGLGNTTVVIALALYAIMPTLQNTYEGFRSVDPIYLEIGEAMGMTALQVFRAVELPLALPVILAGLRIALVTSIGIATIGVFVGGGGLGVLIYRGLQLIDTRLILEGAIPAALLAIVVEVLFGWVERWLRQNTR